MVQYFLDLVSVVYCNPGNQGPPTQSRGWYVHRTCLYHNSRIPNCRFVCLPRLAKSCRAEFCVVGCQTSRHPNPWDLPPVTRNPSRMREKRARRPPFELCAALGLENGPGCALRHARICKASSLVTITAPRESPEELYVRTDSILSTVRRAPQTHGLTHGCRDFQRKSFENGRDIPPSLVVETRVPTPRNMCNLPSCCLPMKRSMRG